ncbi:ATP-dependent RNA helicase SUPV3L1, mitochondrial-like [Psammomys obesus]|uniref:ATP-dependent RNA helicase SUPV3L1, mitochondrial-like n=1 Tax=Psammomys obesus TaxID=48139 RepID=UPI00245316AA|nr:ATP-dependent RNA helicase SUPV3L1, mitochondrial-like [Psammomys obesus]
MYLLREARAGTALRARWVLSVRGRRRYVTVRRPVGGVFPGSCGAAVSMSLPRCALLWARLPAGRGAGPQTAASSALRALVGPFPGALGRAPCLAASSSASGGSKAPNTSLFVPLTVKPLGPSADGDVGASSLVLWTRLSAGVSWRSSRTCGRSLPTHVDDLFPFFLRHAKQIFPVLECKDDLRKISDLRIPPNWYPEARAIQRKIIFHSGPTNSGKTYHAIQRYLSAKSGVYCGPLKLLAHKIFEKSNAADVPCELVTGEERLTVAPEGKEATHVSCTVEMCNVTTPWLCAEEVHLCGESAAIDLVSELLYTTGEEVEAAGLHPTAEQIEMFACHLPETTLSNLIDIFVDFAQVDGQYFVCNMDDFKFSAELIQHIPLSLRVRYVFCTAPINKKQPFVCSSLLQFARQYSRNEPLTFAWLRRYIKWPLLPPKNIKDLMDLEAVHDVFDLYLWLSYRFLDMFPDSSLVRGLQKELDTIIQDGVHNITKLIKISESHKLLNLEGVLGEDQSRFSGTAKSPARRTRGTKSSGSKAEEPVSPSAKELPLASRLVQQGLLTADMLKQLQKEWLTQRTDHGKEKAGTRRKKTDHNSD